MQLKVRFRAWLSRRPSGVGGASATYMHWKQKQKQQPPSKQIFGRDLQPAHVMPVLGVVESMLARLLR